MKRFLVLSFALLLIYSCASSKKASNSDTTSEIIIGNEGTSYEKAVVIMEKTETTGVDAEYAWLRKHYPGYKMKEQSLQSHDNKSYDVLKIKTADGKNMSIYFDISNFFGKF